MFGPKKIRWKEKKLRKFFFSFVWSAEKKKEKKYDRKLDGKFGKINGKNFPHILVRKTVEKKASTDPEPLLSSAALNLARHRSHLPRHHSSLSLLLSPRRAPALLRGSQSRSTLQPSPLISPDIAAISLNLAYNFDSVYVCLYYLGVSSLID